MRAFREKEKGLTLVEMAITLGAMGLILGALWSVVGVVWRNYQGFRAREQIVEIAQNVRTYYMNAKKIDCTGNESILSKLNNNDRRLIPIEMRESAKDDNGAVNHALAAMGGGSFDALCLDEGRAFRLKLKGVAKEDCISLLMQFPVLMPELGVQSVVIPGGTVKNVNLLDIDSPADGFPLTLSRAESWCDNKTNEVSFDFKLRN